MSIAWQAVCNAHAMQALWDNLLQCGASLTAVRAAASGLVARLLGSNVPEDHGWLEDLAFVGCADLDSPALTQRDDPEAAAGLPALLSLLHACQVKSLGWARATRHGIWVTAHDAEHGETELNKCRSLRRRSAGASGRFSIAAGIPSSPCRQCGAVQERAWRAQQPHLVEHLKRSALASASKQWQLGQELRDVFQQQLLVTSTR